MQEQKEMQSEKDSDSSMLAQENQKLREYSIQLEQELVTGSQAKFNKYQMSMNEVILKEILNLKEGLNQLGESLAGKESEEEVEEVESEEPSKIPRSKYDDEIEAKEKEIARLEEQIKKDAEIKKKVRGIK